MLWDRYDYVFFTQKQTAGREVKQLNQGRAVLIGRNRTECPDVYIRSPLSWALLCIVAHSIIMMKSIGVFAPILKDLSARGSIQSVFLCILTHLILAAIFEVGTGSFLFYRKKEWSIKRLNNLPKVIQLLKWENQVLNSGTMALQAGSLTPTLYCLHILLHNATAFILIWACYL